MNNGRVLVVENNAIVCHVISLMLKDFDYDFLIVNSGYAALDALREEKFDIMLTDFGMPGMNGMQLVENVRKNDDKLEIIMMTATPALIIREKAIKFKISAILPKPFLMNNLLSLLSKVEAAL